MGQREVQIHEWGLVSHVVWEHLVRNQKNNKNLPTH